jgi:hypothetical protein
MKTLKFSLITLLIVLTLSGLMLALGYGYSYYFNSAGAFPFFGLK